MPETTARPITDARFLDVLTTVADQVVDATGEGRNGDTFQAYRDVVDVFETPAAIPYTVWLREQIEGALRKPASEPVRSMLEARDRLGENVLLIAEIDLKRLRGALDKIDPIGAEDLDMLLDFVAEVRKIAKDI